MHPHCSCAIKARMCLHIQRFHLLQHAEKSAGWKKATECFHRQEERQMFLCEMVSVCEKHNGNQGVENRAVWEHSSQVCCSTLPCQLSECRLDLQEGQFSLFESQRTTFIVETKVEHGVAKCCLPPPMKKRFLHFSLIGCWNIQLPENTDTQGVETAAHSPVSWLKEGSNTYCLLTRTFPAVWKTLPVKM